MNWVVSFAKSSIGAKVVVALSGVLLVGFVLQHMLGNLQLFAGPEQFNNYAYTLKSLGPLLWVARLGLLGILVMHVGMALRVQSLNRAARPMRYKNKQHQSATLASRSMLLGGLMIFAFVLYHLAHFTLGFVDGQFLEFTYKLADGTVVHDAYKMTVLGFQNIVVVGLYVCAMALLTFHLGHGVSSMFQTLGLNHPKYRPLIQGAGPALGVAIFLGFVSIPIAVQLGIIQLQGGAS